MRHICIIGIGWLGLELAKNLKSKGYYVSGTVTSESKRIECENNLDKVYVFNMEQEELEYIEKTDLVIITIPPSSSSFYSSKLNIFLTEWKISNPSLTVFYTSSTSVYGNLEREVSESSEILPISDAATRICDVESFIAKNFKDKFAVFRLGGLVGGERHPVKYLSGRRNIAKPLAPINLLHREDAIRGIIYLIENFKPGVYNLCSPMHPTKKEFYKQIATQLSLPMLYFNETDKRKDKVVNCRAIKALNFEFKYNSPYDFPTETN